ncbi:exosortase [Hahella sp. SMD15-11]|uniref:Exosortase n=1 Tax=Thermohahella caldifontis TaxID=3142973 RepID=A0AB39UXD6_9GAMM
MATPIRITQQWPASIWAGILILAGWLFTLPTWMEVVPQWTIMDGAYSHGFLAFGVFIWLLHHLRPELDGQPVQFSWIGAVWVLLSLAGILLGTSLLIEAVEQLAAFVLPFALVWMVLGWPVAQRLILPAGILFTAVPVWDVTSYALQSLTVAVDHFLLGFSDIDFEVNDIFVTLKGLGTFEIATGCSGLRYFLVGLVVAQLNAILYVRSWPRRLSIIGIGILFSLAANWLRVYIIILVGYYSKMESGLIRDHEAFGWVLFAVMLVIFYFVSRRLEDAPDGQPQGTPGTAAPAVVSGTALACVVLAGIVSLGLYADQRQPSSVTDAQIAPLPERMGHYSRLPIMLDPPWKPIWKGYDRLNAGAYIPAEQTPLGSVYVFDYWYINQKPGREMIQDANRFYDSYRWKLIHQDQITQPDGNLGVLVLESLREGGASEFSMGSRSEIVTTQTALPQNLPSSG